MAAPSSASAVAITSTAALSHDSARSSLTMRGLVAFVVDDPLQLRFADHGAASHFGTAKLLDDYRRKPTICIAHKRTHWPRRVRRQQSIAMRLSLCVRRTWW